MAKQRSAEKIDGRIAAGEATRKRILEEAVEVASTEGFSAISIGTLAQRCGMSKAGLFSHFKSREALLLATLNAAYDEFDQLVMAPCRAGAPNERMRLFLRHYFAYLRDRASTGACVLTSSVFEFEGSDGKLRDRVVELMELRRNEMRAMVVEATSKRTSAKSKVDADQVVFVMESLFVGLVYRYQISQDMALFDRLVRALRHVIPDSANLTAPPIRTKPAPKTAARARKAVRRASR